MRIEPTIADGAVESGKASACDDVGALKADIAALIEDRARHAAWAIEARSERDAAEERAKASEASNVALIRQIGARKLDAKWLGEERDTALAQVAALREALRWINHEAEVAGAEDGTIERGKTLRAISRGAFQALAITTAAAVKVEEARSRMEAAASLWRRALDIAEESKKGQAQDMMLMYDSLIACEDDLVEQIDALDAARKAAVIAPDNSGL